MSRLLLSLAHHEPVLNPRLRQSGAHVRTSCWRRFAGAFAQSLGLRRRAEHQKPEPSPDFTCPEPCQPLHLRDPGKISVASLLPSPASLGAGLKPEIRQSRVNVWTSCCRGFAGARGSAAVKPRLINSAQEKKSPEPTKTGIGASRGGVTPAGQSLRSKALSGAGISLVSGMFCAFLRALSSLKCSSPAAGAAGLSLPLPQKNQPRKAKTRAQERAKLVPNKS